MYSIEVRPVPSSLVAKGQRAIWVKLKWLCAVQMLGPGERLMVDLDAYEEVLVFNIHDTQSYLPA